MIWKGINVTTHISRLYLPYHLVTECNDILNFLFDFKWWATVNTIKKDKWLVTALKC